MITSVEMVNFLSHKETKLNFDEGVTVFVGQNGAGKSSIIDAITFALFGQHTRKSNKGLIKRGNNHGYAKVSFVINGRNYQAERKVDSKGILGANLSEIIDGKVQQIASGERKQFGESMTKEVEKRIGLDFQKLKIASIVQQGELNSIIKAKPKEFKELLNAIIGIDKLDVAFESMKYVTRNFRDYVKKEIGFNDTHIEFLSNEIEKLQKDVQQAEPLKKELAQDREKLYKEMGELKKKLEEDIPKIEKLSQLESRKNELFNYAKEAIQGIQKEIFENERKIRECKPCFEKVGQIKILESKLTMIEDSILSTQEKIQSYSNKKTSLHERKELAQKLELKDNKCPVCDSHVEKLNPLFQIQNLNDEEYEINNKIINLKKELSLYKQKNDEFSKKLLGAKNSETILKTHSISNQEELVEIQKLVEIKKENLSRIPLTVNSGNLLEISQLDSHARLIFENISRLEEQTKGFDVEEFSNLKNTLNKKQNKLSEMDQKIGAITEKIRINEEKIIKIKNDLKYLETVKKYIDELELIQSNVFGRDGPVSTSLRSWALGTISSKASEYLSHLNSKIQRIQLSEKARDISISCYSKSEVLDLESLSGGEQVSIALSLRLGMASLLGASNLNLMILDEPTTHLDSERRRALVGVLSQLSNIRNSGRPMQFIIITHDAEIFEDSTVEKIYKFEASEQGSLVNFL